MPKKLIRLPTEWFATYKEAASRAAELTKQGWRASYGQMRRESGPEWYIRIWKWEKVK